MYVYMCTLIILIRIKDLNVKDKTLNTFWGGGGGKYQKIVLCFPIRKGFLKLHRNKNYK